MKTKNVILMVALAALTCSCAKENIVNEGGPKPAASKVINTPENADAESILIYVADGVAGTGAIDSSPRRREHWHANLFSSPIRDMRRTSGDSVLTAGTSWI